MEAAKQVYAMKHTEVPLVQVIPKKAAPSATTQAAPTPAPAKASSSKVCDDVEEVECAAKQQESSSKGKPSARAAATPSPSAAGPPGLVSSLNNSVAIQLAVTQINSGQVLEAEGLLDKVLRDSPRELGALVARGTARALRRELQGAVDDFTVAIEVEPRYADSWKRRGQANSALGNLEAALLDLQKAVELLPMWGQETSASRAECALERGMIYQKQRDYRRGCKELREAVKLDASNAQAWNLLGLCSTSQGDIRDGVEAYKKAVELKPDLKEAWINMAQALKEEGKVKDAERAFARVMALDQPDSPSVHALRMLGQMRQQRGDHLGAIKILDKAIAFKKEDHMVELLYMRAICHHALGYMREAVRDYEETLTWTRGNVSEEGRTFQFLSFYQKEIVLHMNKNLDRPVVNFCWDTEMPALFKEMWCKKQPPTPELISTYAPQPPLAMTPPTAPPRHELPKLKSLTNVADVLGTLLQYSHQGFLPNVRQQRAAGYAAIELAQAVTALLAAKRAGNELWWSSEGSSGEGGTAGRHPFGWRDGMDLVVKWRQLAEPNDQVVWVDLLTRKEFEQGFGSHTPMFSGQTKCVRYYMNFKRALALQKEVLLRDGHAYDAQNRTIPLGSPPAREAIAAATSAEDMYRVIQQDSWVVVHIHSTMRPGHMMEGTRLTLVKVPNQPDAYEFSIRTPVTPPRWQDFDVELEACWDAVIKALLEGDRQEIGRAILTYAYYWYNFMPLARGTAAVGYTTILSLFMAADMPITARIPVDYQVDWEAILSQQSAQFIESVSKWLFPGALRGACDDNASCAALARELLPELSSLPSVSEVLGTMRRRLEALNDLNNSSRRVG